MLPTENGARKQVPLFTFLTEYFPDAIEALVGVAVAGNIQHNPELDPADIVWDRGKSRDQMNTAMRHQWDYGRGVKRDTDGQWHLGKAAWRLLAQLQLDIEAERAAPPCSCIRASAIGCIRHGFEMESREHVAERLRRDFPDWPGEEAEPMPWDGAPEWTRGQE